MYRLISEPKLILIAKSESTVFPPRLPEQPIFYPVLNERYSAEIAKRWNTKDKNSDYKGYVIRFEIDDSFIAGYEVQTFSRSYHHQEYWIPAEDLPAFNRHILGKIEVIATANDSLTDC